MTGGISAAALLAFNDFSLAQATLKAGRNHGMARTPNGGFRLHEPAC
jgi:hypothetical protein